VAIADIDHFKAVNHPTATSPGTPCSPRSPPPCGTCCATATCAAGSVARSSPCYSACKTEGPSV
jgi:hypothetical protein